MEIVGSSSLYVEKYRPRCINDLILPETTKAFLKQITADKEIPNMILSGTAGKGKTSAAYAICNDIDADVLYINASLETGVDTLRYKVMQFATTSSFSDGKKIVILDEFDRTSPQGQDASKGLIEQCEANCRFIITTNNFGKIIDPIKSRCQHIDFNFGQKETKNLVVAYFKRICWILDQEKVKYDKAVMAEFVQKLYPDFRKILNELQKFVKMHGSISADIFSTMDETIMGSLVTELKNKKFNAVRKIATDMDPDTFYGEFYSQIDHLLEPKCLPNIILTLGKYAYESSLTINKELTLVSCLIELMRDAQWK